jgi:hypothetical protein
VRSLDFRIGNLNRAIRRWKEEKKTGRQMDEIELLKNV